MNQSPASDNRSVLVAGLRLLLGALLVWLAPTCLAAPQWCGGTVANLYLDLYGNAYVLASWRGDYVRICNVNQPTPVTGVQASVSTVDCLAWVSLLRSAVERKAATTIFYQDSPTACNSMATYGNAPVPAYVMLED